MSHVEQIREVHDRLIQVHDDLVGELMVNRAPIIERKLDVGDLADIGYFLRELERHLDEMRKDCKARKELIARLICLHATMKMQEGEDSGRVVGKYASANPDLGYVPVLPKRGTPEYDDLMASIGVPKEAYADGLVTPHWKHVQEWLEERAASGQDVPKGVTTRPDYRATFHRRKKADG